MRRAATALLAALVGLTSVSCSDSTPPEASPSTSATPSGTPSEPPVPPTPKRGACYRLSLTELTQPTSDSPAVPCARNHTAQTIFVGRLRLVVDGHAIAVDSKRVQRQVATACPPKMAAHLGGEQEDRDLSRFRIVWFSPTLGEADAGARWFRCDLVAFGRGERLYAQKGRVPAGVLAGEEGRNRYGLCGTAAPGAAGFERVLCSMSHSWRAIATIAIEGGPAYPGEAAVREAGDTDCSDLVREAENFALTFTYGWEWPTRAQWRAGQRFGYCWAPVDSLRATRTSG